MSRKAVVCTNSGYSLDGYPAQPTVYTCDEKLDPAVKQLAIANGHYWHRGRFLRAVRWSCSSNQATMRPGQNQTQNTVASSSSSQTSQSSGQWEWERHDHLLKYSSSSASVRGIYRKDKGATLRGIFSAPMKQLIPPALSRQFMSPTTGKRVSYRPAAPSTPRVSASLFPTIRVADAMQGLRKAVDLNTHLLGLKPPPGHVKAVCTECRQTILTHEHNVEYVKAGSDEWKKYFTPKWTTKLLQQKQ